MPWWLSVVLCGSSASASDLFDSNGNLWLNYVGDHPFSGTPWGLHLEAQTRRAELGNTWQQLLIRPGINYAVNEKLSISAGWAYVETHPYGDYPAKHSFPEHRAWEQVQYTSRALGLDWQHRFRLEQRWIGEMKNFSGNWVVQNRRYENRARYMLRTTVPISENKKNYVALWDEVFVNFGTNVQGNVFDQNRAFIGLGRKMTDTTRVEVGFLEQTVHRRFGTIWENNHTLCVWVLSRWPFGKS